jgi:hypothetical protein
MALTTRVTLQAQVADYYERSITRRSDGQVFTFRNAVLLAPGTLAEVRIPDELSAPSVGQTIRVVCTVGSYADQPELSVISYEEPVKG